MFVRRLVFVLCVAVCIATMPNSLQPALAVNAVSVCHDGIWDDGEYCGFDARVVTGVAEMNHDCLVDGLDVGLFALQYNSTGPNLSADLNGNNQVSLVDYAIFGTTVGQTASPCAGVAIPSVCQGSLKLSFSANPATVVDNVSQALGTYIAYVIMDGFGSDARIVEYAIDTSPNVTIVTHTPIPPNTLYAPFCQLGNTMVMATLAPLASGPVAVAQIEYQLTDSNPATITITPGGCSWGRVRWTTSTASISYDFEVVLNAGINGPTPPPTTNTCRGTVSGKIYADLFVDCLQTPVSDFPVVNRKIEVTPGPYFAFTNDAGNYSLSLPIGPYTVTQAPIAGDPWLLSFCQSSGSYPAWVTAGAALSGNDFALRYGVPPQCDVSVNIASVSAQLVVPPCVQATRGPCPDIEHQYNFVVRSKTSSNTPIAAGSIVDMTLDPSFTISAVTSGFAMTQLSSSGPNQRTFLLNVPIYPGQVRVVKVRATSPSGGPYLTQMSFNDNGACTGVSTASLSEASDCRCSFDPNDVSVSPEGCGPNYEIVGDVPLTYTIRFENIGTGPAHDVVLRDVLDADLDLSSLYVVDASHTMTSLQVEPGNILVMRFDGIELPGNYDPANSRGQVVFAIEPNPSLADGTTIENYAEITFDQNDPVVTNTVFNTIQATPCPATGIGQLPKTYLSRNRPNPFNPTTTIDFGLARAGQVTISVYSVTGQRVRTLANEYLPAGPHSIVWDGRDEAGNAAASGVYLYQMQTEGFTDTKKLVLLK